MKLSVPQQEYIGYQPTPDIIRKWAMETESLYRRIDPLFIHPASRLHARQYLHGLLSPLEKKNSWTIGELADENPKKLQRFLNLATWDAGELLNINRSYAMEHFADRSHPRRRSDGIRQERQEIGRRAAPVFRDSRPCG